MLIPRLAPFPWSPIPQDDRWVSQQTPVVAPLLSAFSVPHHHLQPPQTTESVTKTGVQQGTEWAEQIEAKGIQPPKRCCTDLFVLVGRDGDEFGLLEWEGDELTEIDLHEIVCADYVHTGYVLVHRVQHGLLKFKKP